MGIPSLTLASYRSLPFGLFCYKYNQIKMANLSLYSLFVAIIFAYTVSVSFGLYLGTGGVVGSSNPRHRITPRTGYRTSSYSPRRSSGRIINYGVVSGSGGYRPAHYSPGPGIVG